MNDKVTDKFVIMLFYISIILLFYYYGLAQSNVADDFSVPMYILYFPFVVASLQSLRILIFINRLKFDTLSRLWVFIFLWYIIVFYFDSMTGHGYSNYNTIWYIVCPPVAWVYFTLVVKAKPSIKNTLVKWNFWFFIILSIISLYFIPLSVRDNGLFASLNTGYFVLFAYPMVLLNKSKLKKVIATFLLVLILFLSMKRGGIMAMALAFVLYIMFATKINIFKKTVVIAICIGALFYIVPKINELSNGTLQVRYEFTQNEGDEEGRASMYPMIWTATMHSDFAEITFGHGHNAVVANNVLYGLSAHNDYLEFLYDYGLVGLFLLLMYQWQLLKITYRSYKYNKEFLSALFAFSGIFVLSMVSIVYAYYYFLVIIPFWCVMNDSYRYYKKEGVHIR